MIERFFLYGVDAKTAGASVGRQDDLIVPAGADKTKTALAFVEPAKTRAQIVLQPSVVECVPVAAGERAGGILSFSIFLSGLQGNLVCGYIM